MQILDSFTLPDITEPESLKKSRKMHFERFSEMGLPARKSDGYDYEDYSALFSKRFTPATGTQFEIPESSYSYAVLLNGIYSKELSKHVGLDVLPLSQAYKTYGTLLTN